MKFAVELLLSQATGLCCIALALFCLIRWQCVPIDRKRTELMMVAAIAAMPLTVTTYRITEILGRIRSTRLDLYVYKIDTLIGAPSFALGRVLSYHTTFCLFLEVCYDCLPLALLFVFIPYLWLKPTREAVRVVVTFAINFAAAVPIYLLVPVSGPLFAFPSFPAAPGPVVPHLIHLQAAPNGIPSVHASTALLVLLFLWEWPLARVAALVFALLTICVTLGSGQHYAFDLLCAIPYTLGIYLLCKRYCTRPRIRLGETVETSATEFVPS